MISLNIDVNKINKDRLFKGQKGTYLDAVLIETPNSEYGDYMIVESISKEERDAGQKGTILGNAKIIARQTQTQDQQTRETIGHDEADGNKDDDSDLPF